MMLKRQKWAGVGVAVLGLCSAVLLFATTFQLTQVTSTDIEKNLWGTSSIAWSLNPSNSIVYSAGNSTSGTTLATESVLQGVMNTGFSLWSGAQYQSTNVDTLAFTEGADNANTSFNSSDCTNSIGFTQNLGTAVIAVTSVTTQSTTPITTGWSYCPGAPNAGTCPYEVCITDADIEFNTSYRFYTTAYTLPTGGYPSDYFDLQTVATHEIGHLLGLDHTGLANAVMYPYGDSGNGGVKYSLAIDDMIGIGELYPNSSILSLTGGIKGTVTVGGNPAYAAHVVAIDSATGNVVTDTLADNNGNYHLRMFQGNYYVLALPLATDTSGDSGTNGVTGISNYRGFSAGYPSSTPVTNFTGKYY